MTHFLWGSFEPPPYYEINPESWALELEQSANGARLDRCAGSVSFVARHLLSGSPLSGAVTAAADRRALTGSLADGSFSRGTLFDALVPARI